MSAGQIAAPAGRVSAPIVTVMVAAAFAAGALTGINLPRTVSDGGHASEVTGSVGTRTFPGVAVNNMSDAVHQAQFHAFKGVADNNMSDAAYEAHFGSK